MSLVMMNIGRVGLSYRAFPMERTEHVGCDDPDCGGTFRPADESVAWAFTRRGLDRKVIRYLKRRAETREQIRRSESLGG